MPSSWLDGTRLGVSLLVVMIWLELCTIYSSSGQVVTTTSIILCFNKHQLTQSTWKMAVKTERERERERERKRDLTYQHPKLKRTINASGSPQILVRMVSKVQKLPVWQISYDLHSVIRQQKDKYVNIRSWQLLGLSASSFSWPCTCGRHDRPSTRACQYDHRRPQCLTVNHTSTVYIHWR